VIEGAAFLLFVVGVLVYVVILYNELVRLRNDNDRAWANIDVLLKQRHDEIPNLVETVKGYMQHEQQTLLAVTQARAASMNAASIRQKAQADLKMTDALRGLFAVAENYPQLKANENFLKLQTRISELEERIADRREFFNDDVNTYNTRIGQIPEVFVASYHEPEAARHVPGFRGGPAAGGGYVSGQRRSRSVSDERRSRASLPERPIGSALSIKPRAKTKRRTFA
jgi:LemA protein